jgi:hypothetical protein
MERTYVSGSTKVTISVTIVGSFSLKLPIFYDKIKNYDLSTVDKIDKPLAVDIIKTVL